MVRVASKPAKVGKQTKASLFAGWLGAYVDVARNPEDFPVRGPDRFRIRTNLCVVPKCNREVPNLAARG